MMRATTTTTTMAAALAALAAVGAALGQCGAGAGPCGEPHDGPGCVNPSCCELVCVDYPACCEVTWDQQCADLANDVCDWVTCGEAGSCVAAHGTPGCEDIACCEWTCPLDFFCCNVAWDEFCAYEALRLCDVAPCTIDIPKDAVDEDEHCYDRINDGCNIAGFPMVDVTLPALRSGKHSSGSPRDTDWYRFTLDARRRVRLTLRSEFPGLAVLVQGPCLGPIGTVAEASCLPCGETVIDVCLEPGTYACLVSAGDDQRIYRTAFTCDEIDPDDPPDPRDPPPIPSPYGLRYVLRMEGWSCVLGDLDGDGVVGQTDLAILLGSWGAAGGEADLDGDGAVGSTDLAILLGAWSA